jgi:molybdopterin-guanine dinucleotide biosynthesis protein B
VVSVPIISIIGWHNAGKTTFLAGLIRALKERGLCVATIKHTGGEFAVDHPGTDTSRYAAAGSDVVVIVGKQRMALIEQTPEELPLAEVLARLPRGMDLIVTEGYKRIASPKIEIVRSATGTERIARDEELLALITDEAALAATAGAATPVFGTADVAGVVELLVARGIIR